MTKTRPWFATSWSPADGGSRPRYAWGMGVGPGRRTAATPSDARQRASCEELLLRETNHRWCNDLQLIVGLLALQSRRAANPEVRQSLTDAMERISILSRARSAMCREQQTSLGMALEQVCEALGAQAESRSITIILDATHDVAGLAERQITALALVVNELTTNAIKHAFKADKPGQIRISMGVDKGRDVTISVDDDGDPFDVATADGDGLGLGLVGQLMASIGGRLDPPAPGSKTFKVQVPVIVA